MRSLVTCCVLLGGILFSCAKANDDDMQQRHVEWESPFSSTNARSKMSGQRRRSGGVGHSCKGSEDCNVRLCCRRNNGGGTCQRLSYPGEPCSDGQIKGGMYANHCPCVYGEDNCQNGYCITDSWWQR
ncbi:U-scoloptoxin(18)-Er1a [Rhipicephalus sanguineus]|uniref:U-scoloptoxin(18)-Er1a n=1 Tax=Rhipicephalus sanguineus TaxID=34632 RepID=UPI0018959095|nr:U-scoloptoxin(18)-Er1a [Rhipicephalus sanguineus]